MNDTKPLTSRVYDYVFDSIVTGRFNSNDILTESRLIAEMQVSKSPVREALITLCEEGVLRSIPRVGYKVVQIMPYQVAKLTEARLVLELSMLEKGWNSISSLEIQQLQNLELRIEKAGKRNVVEHWNDNFEFHMMIAGFSNNEYLIAALRHILKDCSRAAAQYFVDENGNEKDNRNYHPLILQSLKERKYDDTVHALQMDICELL